MEDAISDRRRRNHRSQPTRDGEVRNTALTAEVSDRGTRAKPTGMSDDEHELGEGTGRQGPWAEEDEEHRADKQQGDPDALEVEGDPRGGLQSAAYRSADPRDLVEEDGVVMSGPGGAPQDGDPEAREG
jgi:hypothetical protein